MTSLIALRENQQKLVGALMQLVFERVQTPDSGLSLADVASALAVAQQNIVNLMIQAMAKATTPLVQVPHIRFPKHDGPTG